MSLSDFHVHTTFSDGKNTPEEMVQAALKKGMNAIGFSDHSYTFFDESYCIPKNRISEYQETIQELKEKYRGKIKIFCGIEQDLFSAESVEGFDYVIGSVHYLKLGDTYIPVDENPQILQNAARDHFGGNMYSLITLYFSEVSQVAERNDVDIVGHFDLIRKFNRGQRLFSESDPRYVSAARSAADRLLQSGKIFEINTGAIARGYRTEAYPAKTVLQYLQERRAKLLASSDSHRAEQLCFGFAELPSDRLTTPL